MATYLAMTALWLAGCGYAAVIGRSYARVTGFMLASQYLLELLADAIPRDPHAARPVTGATDLLLLAWLIWVALRRRVGWAAPAVAFQFLSVLTHVAKLILPSARGWAYVTGGTIWGFALLAAVVAGAYRERQRGS